MVSRRADFACPDAGEFAKLCSVGGCRETIFAAGRARPTDGRSVMAESVYKIIELVGTSPDSWEEAASNAVERASDTLRDLRVAEVSELDMKVEDGKVVAYRARVKVSFKFEE